MTEREKLETRIIWVKSRGVTTLVGTTPGGLHMEQKLFPCFRCAKPGTVDFKPACDECLAQDDFQCCNCGKSGLRFSENEVCFAWLRCWCSECFDLKFKRTCGEVMDNEKIEEIEKKFAEAGVKVVWETGEPVSIVGTRNNGGDSLPKKKA